MELAWLQTSEKANEVGEIYFGYLLDSFQMLACMHMLSCCLKLSSMDVRQGAAPPGFHHIHHHQHLEVALHPELQRLLLRQQVIISKGITAPLEGSMNVWLWTKLHDHPSNRCWDYYCHNITRISWQWYYHDSYRNHPHWQANIFQMQAECLALISPVLWQVATSEEVHPTTMTKQEQTETDLHDIVICVLLTWYQYLIF